MSEDEKPLSLFKAILFLGLGITSIITPIQVIDEGLLTNDVFWMLGISFLLLPLIFIPKSLRLGWRDGIVLLGIYITFVYITLN